MLRREVPQQQLVRRFVGQRLAEYYAQPADQVVGISAGVDQSNLSSLLGQWHWRRFFKKVYEEREGHWLTPVELFRPHYSNILAEFCAANLGDGPGDQAIDIIELGGGRGTNASLMLSHLQDTKPEIYERIRYTLVDSSPSLHKLQQRELSSGEHAGKLRFERKDLMDVAEAKVTLLPKSDTPTVVLGMEVLDNLPHDKVRARSRKRIEQAEVKLLRNGGYEEVFTPTTDPLIASVVKTVPSYQRSYPTWIPTVACGVFQHLFQQRPNLTMIFADFDWLPAPDVELSIEDSRLSTWAEGEPIVTDMEGRDHPCYLRAPSNCDILFPTDFEKLGLFVKRAAKRKDLALMVQKQPAFLQQYGAEHVRATKSWLTGHTPLLHDFANCSVLTVTNGLHEQKQ